MKIDICITRIRYTFREKQRLHQNWYFHNVKQVYICWYQRNSSKLIFWSHETGIHFWKSPYFIKIEICITWIRYTFLEKQRLHQNWYFHYVKQVYIFWYQRTSSKLIFLSHETGIHFWKSTYFMQIRYLYNLNQVYITEKQRLHQNWYFYNLKRVYNFGNQHTSSKLILIKPETCIHFWKSTYFFKINILIPWNRYSFLEINILHENRSTGTSKNKLRYFL